jgi:hypothetical protein
MRLAATIASLALMSSYFAGCAKPVPAPVLTEPSAHAVQIGDPDFAPGLTILSGFDTPRHGHAWGPGIHALLGIKVTNGSRRDVWFIHLESQPLDPEKARTTSRRFRYHHQDDGEGFIYTATSPVGAVKVSLHDRHGKLLEESLAEVPFGFLRNGPAVSSQRIHSLDESAEDAGVNERMVYADGVLALMSMVQAVRTAPATRPIVNAVWNVIDPPDLFSIIFGPGLTLDLNADFENAMEVSTLGAAPVSPQSWMPFPISANDKPALIAEVVSGPTDPPYLLTSGILRLVGRHPRFADRSVAVELLAARILPISAN